MLEKEIAKIEVAQMSELRESFKRYFGWDCKARNKEFLRSRIIYRLQELEFGGLSMTVKYLLNSMHIPDPKIQLSNGTVLEKSYKGNFYRIEVCQGYFLMNDVQYKTLSAVAYAISHQRISGNRFFNLDGGKQ